MQSVQPSPPSANDLTDHIEEARDRARRVLAGEAHLGNIDDWRQAIVSARDAVVAVWVLWVALQGLGDFEHVGALLVSAGLGVSVYLGIAKAQATRVLVRHFEHELERERREIREDPDHEREEVRALYAAKGFRDPLLTQITDTLCAEDDRLLKVMMEEELGLFARHVNHPLLVGAWNMLGAATGTLLLAAPVCFQNKAFASGWMPAATAVILAAGAAIRARTSRRPVVPEAVTWLLVAAITGGLTHFLAALLAGRS